MGVPESRWRQLGDVPALERIGAFRRAYTVRQAAEVVEVPIGFLVVNREYAISHDHNKLVLTEPAAAPDLVATVDQVYADAGLAHRLVEAGDQHGPAVAERFAGAGYRHQIQVVMRYHGGAPAECTIAVTEVTTAELADLDRRLWLAHLPQLNSEQIEQLTRRRALRVLAADHVAFLAVRDAGGDIVASADLYLDPGAGVAQIEEVKTDPRHRGRGYAAAIFAEATRRAGALDAHVLFLLADADDWTRHWYSRLGYAEIDRIHLFRRLPRL